MKTGLISGSRIWFETWARSEDGALPYLEFILSGFIATILFFSPGRDANPAGHDGRTRGHQQRRVEAAHFLRVLHECPLVHEEQSPVPQTHHRQ